MSGFSERPNTLPWPPIIYLAAVAVGIILIWLVPLPWIASPFADILFAIGWLLIAAAVAMDVAAIRAMRRANTTVRPDQGSAHLVTTGPFAFTRNPLYLGNTMIMIGIGLVAGSLWFLLLALVAAFATQKLAIEREERHLEVRFGKKFRDYAKRVRRWI
jgi:protein-S-isoprenylcysteine O-methyltransferase Ste14